MERRRRFVMNAENIAENVDLARRLGTAVLTTAQGGYSALQGARSLYNYYYNPRTRRYYRKKKILRSNKRMPRRGRIARSFKRRLSGRENIYGQKVLVPRTRKYTSMRNGQKVVSSSKASYRRPYRKQKSVSKQLREVKKALRSDQADFTYKYITTGLCGTSQVGQCTHTYIPCSTSSLLETYASQLRYYDPSVPATLLTAPAGTGTFHREVHFTNVYARLHLRNNRQTPCKAKVYVVYPKISTDVVPLTAYTNGITDQVVSGGNSTTIGISLTDIKPFTKNWNVKCLKDVSLDAGAEITVNHSVGSFDYDPSEYDTDTNPFQRKWKPFAFIVRVQGVLGHDTSLGQYTNIFAGLDYENTVIAKMTYDAGNNFDFIYIDDNRDASFTNAGTVASKPVGDMILHASS